MKKKLLKTDQSNPVIQAYLEAMRKAKCDCSCHLEKVLWCDECKNKHQALIDEMCKQSVEFSHSLEYPEASLATTAVGGSVKPLPQGREGSTPSTGTEFLLGEERGEL